MSTTGFFVALIGAAVFAVGLYVLSWRATVGKSSLVKLLVRAGLPLLVVLPVIVGLLAPTLYMAKDGAAPEGSLRGEYRYEVPTEAEEKNGSVATDATPKVKPKIRTRRAPPAANGDAELAQPPPPSPPAAKPASPGGGVGGTIGGMNAGRDDAGSEVADKMTGEEEPAAAAPPESASRSLAPGAAAPADSESAWDVVPVFYGTDRGRADNSVRLGYGGDRGRRLELGRALVTVPKLHQVPLVERPWAIRIPYFNVTIYEEDEDPNKHFTMQEIKSLSREDLLSLVRQRLATSKKFKDQALVFVHGYNTSFDNGVYRTAQIAYDLEFDGAPFLYSWPSGAGLASYNYDRESSGQSTPYLREFLNLVIKETGAKEVSVIAHSMGNQPLLQVLKDLKKATPDDVVISQVILASPDVDRDAFENIAREIIGLAKGITLYVAANDRALKISQQYYGGVPRAGDVPAGGPIVIEGIDTIDVTAVSTDSLGINHSGYAENNVLLKDISRLIETGAPPGERKPPDFERIVKGDSGYWRYPTDN